MSLFSSEPNIKELEEFLLETFSGTKQTFEDIVVQTLNSPFIEKHYREALKKLNKEGVIKKIHVSTKTDRGFGGKDVAVFS